MNENKTIAVNTVVLTIKLVITLICGFVVSRMVLQALGADNYGLYDVVGGIVALLNLVASSMVATSYRYIAVERGKGGNGNSRLVFSTLMTIHVFLAFMLFIIGLPLGILYIENYLNVTNASIGDAHFVFVFSLLAAFFSVVTVPCNGLLIAEEKFVPIAMIDICKSLLNVAVAIVLLNYLGNRLRLYAVLMAVVMIGNTIAYQIFCRIKYKDIVKFQLNRNKKDYKDILSFTGWMFIGATAVIGRTQGVAMVINLFFRNSINAAFGIATQIGNATTLFTSTLRQSVTPQIMKNQEGNAARSLSLVYAISRYTFLIMLVISVPLLLCMDTILALWLGAENIPPMTAIFSAFLLLNGLIAGLGAGFDASIQASGKVKKNQIGYTIINLSIIPIVYILYRIGLPAYMNVVVGVILTIITLFFQAYIMHELTEFNYKEYWIKTILPSIYTTMVAFIPMFGIRLIIGDSVSTVLCFALGSVVWTSVVVYLLGMNKREKEGVISFIKNKIVKTNNYQV